MLFAVLEFWDFFGIGLVVLLLSGWATAYSYARPTGLRRLRRIEAKLDLILNHLNLEYTEAAGADLSPAVKALADSPGRKIDAIAKYREQTGAGLKEAKYAVETYMARNKGNV